MPVGMPIPFVALGSLASAAKLGRGGEAPVGWNAGAEMSNEPSEPEANCPEGLANPMLEVVWKPMLESSDADMLPGWNAGALMLIALAPGGAAAVSVGAIRLPRPAPKPRSPVTGPFAMTPSPPRSPELPALDARERGSSLSRRGRASPLLTGAGAKSRVRTDQKVHIGACSENRPEGAHRATQDPCVGAVTTCGGRGVLTHARISSFPSFVSTIRRRWRCSLHLSHSARWPLPLSLGEGACQARALACSPAPAARGCLEAT